MRYDRAGAQCDLLTRTDVQNELNLSPREIEIISRAAERRHEAMEAARSENAGDDRAITRVFNRIGDDYVNSTWHAIDRLQRRRAMEIFIQMAKGQSVEDPEIQSELHMTQAQKDQIKKIAHENDVSNDTLLASVNDGKLDSAQFEFKRHENNINMSATLLTVLTDEQTTAFTAMAGKPFTPDPLIDDKTGRRVDQK